MSINRIAPGVVLKHSMPKSIIQLVLAEHWEALGSVIKRHYFLRPFCEDYICVSGEMGEVYHSSVARLVMPFGLLFGALVPYRGIDVPVDVHYNSRLENASLYWDRVFRFPGKDPFHFRSHMEHVRDNEVIEFVRFGVGMRLKVTAENGAIVFRGNGYIWRLFGKCIPIPVGMVLGKAYVEERPVDEDSFRMMMILEHPLFGVMFRYNGYFTVTANQQTCGMPPNMAELPR